MSAATKRTALKDSAGNLLRPYGTRTILTAGQIGVHMRSNSRGQDVAAGAVRAAHVAQVADRCTDKALQVQLIALYQDLTTPRSA